MGWSSSELFHAFVLLYRSVDVSITFFLMCLAISLFSFLFCIMPMFSYYLFLRWFINACMISIILFFFCTIIISEDIRTKLGHFLKITSFRLQLKCTGWVICLQPQKKLFFLINLPVFFHIFVLLPDGLTSTTIKWDIGVKFNLVHSLNNIEI